MERRQAIGLDPGTSYTREQLYSLLEVPVEKRHGAWNRGYREWGGETFIFATVGTGTTSGFDYSNALNADGSMSWTGTNDSHSGQAQIAAILDPSHPAHVFVREQARAPFVYLGIRSTAVLVGERPAQIKFGFGPRSFTRSSPSTFVEGDRRPSLRSTVERSREARQMCLDTWGTACAVCGVDAPWNHVHHLFPVAEGRREVNPVADLRPVCPSCHAMIHWFEPLLSLQEAISLHASLVVDLAKGARQ